MRICASRDLLFGTVVYPKGLIDVPDPHGRRAIELDLASAAPEPARDESEWDWIGQEIERTVARMNRMEKAVAVPPRRKGKS